MGEFIYQVQDVRGGNWREVSKQVVLNTVRVEMGEELVEEIMTEFHEHGMEFPVNGTTQVFRAVRKDGSRIGYESGTCNGQCGKCGTSV